MGGIFCTSTSTTYDRYSASLLRTATQAHRRGVEPLYQCLRRHDLGSNHEPPAEGSPNFSAGSHLYTCQVLLGMRTLGS